MTKSLFIKSVSNEQLAVDYLVLKNTFQEVCDNTIDNSPWANTFPYSPEVSFKVVHSPDFIAIQYSVKEDYIRAVAIRPNENVWEDSCVEFFVSLDNKKTYYNFEFNILGTGLIGFGPEIKTERNRLSAELIQEVKTLTLISQNGNSKQWEMFWVIPKKLISSEDLTGKTLHGNFYKCGDALPKPHFVAWNMIDHPSPNFHLPEFFGELNFE